MVQLFSVILFKWREGQLPVRLCSVYDVSSFGFFQRSGARELCTFISREVVERIALGSRVSVEHKGHLCHAWVRHDGLACAVTSDEDYPQRVAFALIAKSLEGFCNVHDGRWEGAESDMDLATPQLEPMLLKFQDPESADSIMKIQKDLDETRDILIQSIDQLLERGERLDNLMDRSEDLSFQSKAFLSDSERMNSCCIIL